MSQRGDTCLFFPPTLPFYVFKEYVGIVWGFFPFKCVTCLNILIQVLKKVGDQVSLIGDYVGLKECSCSDFGQQARHEGLYDGCGDLPVSHARLHHNSPLARPGLLRPNRRRVSTTDTPHSLSLSLSAIIMIIVYEAD